MRKDTPTRKISFPLEAVFHSSIQDNDNTELWRILNTDSHGLELDSPNHVGITPLHHSVLNNNLDAVKMLVGFGADVNVPDVNGFTPLHTASACGYLQVASFLLLFGADVFTVTQEGDLPLDVAKDSTMSQLLLDNMIFHIHKRTYFHSWVLYHLSELWRTLGHILWYVFSVCRSYICHKVAQFQQQRSLQASQNGGHIPKSPPEHKPNDKID